MQPGRFITFEGGEGCGKSTQSRLLADALRTRGIDVVMTREPGGTTGAETIRNLLLTTEGDGWNPRAEALLFAAARSDHVERLIRPSVASGKWVICDRYLDSSRAYQGGGDDLTDEDLRAIHEVGSRGLLPDVTILLDVAADEVERRLALRDGGVSDRIGGRSAQYHRQVAETFRSFARNETERFRHIDAIGTPGEVHAAVLQVVDRLW